MSKASQECELAGESNDSFKGITLTPPERLWLTEAHKQGFGPVDSRSLRIMLRDKLPKGFSTRSLQEKNLIYGERLSLLGIWHVDPQSEYIKAAERAYAITLRAIPIEGMAESVKPDVSVRSP